ncbi:hypothetical protein LPTSP3_g04800 [Leptospira kobayashii]|uniref:Fibronectin type-III domain-containing protein n=1 Tax=Leptospira kobayashii TaxID=1917830 RepID=A0ABM7UGK5_9LEPT|nr:fibronectin type III domain-containing protein [Leptospira kobayashii]BDA77550.1 hypothetical protein LPTSP3_g04800 [Leptospira kobayashii]
MFTVSLLLGGSSTNSSKSLKPGQTVNLNGGQGTVTGTVVDTNGDGIADGIVIYNGSSGGSSADSSAPPNLILIDSDGDEIPNGVDTNGDGIIDYYLSIGNGSSISLTTQPNGGGNHVTVVPGQGFDSNGDGIVDNPILGQIANDTSPPTSSILPAGGSYPSAVSLTISCSDNIAPSQMVYTTDGSTPSFNPINGIIRNPPSARFTAGAGGNGTYVVKYLCRDLAGNLSITHTETYVIDNNVPTVTASLASIYVSNIGGAINSSLLTWSSNVNGNYSVRSGGTNCTDGVELSNGSATATTPNTATNFAASSLSIGNTTIRVCVTNPNNGFTGSYALTITRDDTPPTVSASPTSGSYITLISVSLTCNDTGGAGCDKIAYSTQTGSAPTDPAITGTTGTITSGVLYSSAIAQADLATTYINFIARDQAGNTSSVSSENYMIDTTIVTPSQVSAIGTGTEIYVQWAPVLNATEYRVYYSTSSPVTTSSASITGISGLYHTITGLASNTTYYVRVDARNGAVGGGVSALSGEQTVFTTTVPVGTAISGGHFDISAGEGANSGNNPRALIDTASGKLLVVTNNGANNGKPSLFRCNLDGNGCTHTDISAGQGTDSGFELTVVIDSASGKLLVMTNNNANNGKLSLFRCNLDGTSCTHTDISAGQGTNSGQAPRAVIDSISGKLLVVSTNGANSSKPSLYRCNLDGTSCTHTDISAGQGANSISLFPGVVIDSVSAKLLVVTCNGANTSKPSLFRCNLDGTSCTHTDISAGQGTSSGERPTVIIDTSSGKLLAFTSNGANGGRPGLFRCNLDGTACTYADVSAGQGASSGTYPSAVIDPISGKILFATMNQFNNSKPGLFRCDADGTNCTHTDISMGQGISSGLRPAILIEPSSGKLFVVTMNLANNTKPSLFIW